MTRNVRGALLQATWTGDKESMIQKHEGYAHEAAKQGAQVMLFQELFYGPYFCQVQDAAVLRLHRAHPRRPDDEADAGPREADRDGPRRARCTRRTRRVAGSTTTPPPSSTPTARYLGKYRKTHIPHVKGFWEKFYFRPGNLGYPVFETAVGKVGVYICYDRHFPEGARALGLNGAEMVFIPSATSRGLSEYLWRIEQPATRSPTATSWARSTGSASRPSSATTTSTARATSATRAASSSAASASPHDEELLIRDMDLELVTQVRQTWQFYRDRRPEAYGDLVRP